MSEQRFVVEITRPVPPEKVALVAERIAERLRMDPGRIVTLLEGRTGPVTKPVLPEKADAIAEVFAQAGVRVMVMAAPLDPPPYVERFGGEEPHDVEPHDVEPQNAEPHDKEPHDVELHDVERHAEEPHDAGRGDEEPRDQDPHVTKLHVEARPADDVPPWDEATSWGFDATVADAWKPRRGDAPREPGRPVADERPVVDDHNAGSHAANQAPDEAIAHDEPGPDPDRHPDRHPDRQADVDRQPDGDRGLDANLGAGLQGAPDEGRRVAPADDPYRYYGSDSPSYRFDSDDDPEEEADRLGPSGSRAGAGAASSAAYSNTPRWVPAAREPDDRPVVGGFYSPGDGRPGGRRDEGWDGEPPREGPRLRTYLLWALIVSLLLLILLQFVVAERSDLGAPLGGFEAGLAAYRRGAFAVAERHWEPLADGGDAQAQYLLGFMAQHGLGQPWSNARAAGWYRRAAQQGLPQAQLALGDLYLRGMGVEPDARVGAAWYGSAAVAGHPEGQFAFARLLLHGTGVEQDFEAALAWFEAAAAGGVAEAGDFVAYARALAGRDD